MVRRILAWGIDFGLVLVLAGFLAVITFEEIAASVPDTTAMAGMGAWQVLSSRGDIPQAAGDVGTSLWRSAARTAELAFAALVILQFAYQFVSVAWRGRTLGKALCGVQVRTRPARPARAQAARRAFATTMTETGLYALACCLLIEGWFALSVLCWLVAVAAFWGNLLPAIGPRRRTVADRLAGTHVVRTRVLRDAAQAALRGAAEGGRRAAEGTRTVLGSAPVQQALSSEGARRLGAAGRQTAERGRGALGRARRAYRDRRAAGRPEAVPAPDEPPALPAPDPLRPFGLGVDRDPRYAPPPGERHASPPHPHPGSPPQGPAYPPPPD